MKITSLKLGTFETNTYIVISGNRAAVIDPAGESSRILDVVKSEGAELVAILLTHGHFDHTTSAAELRAATGAKIHIHEYDNEMLADIDKSYGRLDSPSFNACIADAFVEDGSVVEIGDLRFEVMHTPGHSKGSVCYVCSSKETNEVIFAGDTLFAGSVGRIDGYGGSHDAQMDSLRRLKLLEAKNGDYRVLAGHGEETTLEREKRSNPFLAD
ncbi:MAG: MBL fold metallo-hydrolase [Oscillospiraceae bacterium]|nr:MBL fold metallo-hydrolase [Oscillospiraceae bacterium]